MRLATFQLKAIANLMEAMSGPEQEIILKSCTGSGKTIILTHFMDEYGKSFFHKVFIWLTPGKGDLEEQSKAKMDRYIYGSHTKLLADVMTSGFEENDACFINWEKLTKKGNNALKDGERTNFLEHIRNAQNSGLSFVVIVDESHQNDTVKAADILQYFAPEKIIRCSATPKNYPKAHLIEIPEEDVIAGELIKKMLIINENFAQSIQVENQISYLLEQALSKQRELHSAFLQKGAKVNPLIPDYIISVRGEIWIIETKGGFDRTGKSEDIDIFSPRKFEVLKNYLTKYGLCGGFVREDKQSQEVCICMEEYSEDIKSKQWGLLREIILKRGVGNDKLGLVPYHYKRKAFKVFPYWVPSVTRTAFFPLALSHPSLKSLASSAARVSVLATFSAWPSLYQT